MTDEDKNLQDGADLYSAAWSDGTKYVAWLEWCQKNPGMGKPIIAGFAAGRIKALGNA